MDRHHSTTTPDALTPRQREVAALLAEGLTNAEIAARLGITPGTAANHVARSLRRLGTDNRVRAAVWAAIHGLAASPPPASDGDAGGTGRAAP